jgi:membrane AbrB-like protein
MPDLPIAKLPRGAQWAALVAISAVASAAFEVLGLPAALLLGPMIGGILLGSNGASIRPHRTFMYAAQAMVGCLVARSVTSDIVFTFVKDWPLFLGVVLVIVFLSCVLGWLLARMQILPGTTAVWGTAPGAASAMMVLAGEFGADARLVAFMQYLRVVFVAAFASIVARVWVGGSVAGGAHREWFPPIQWLSFGETLLIAAAGGFLGAWLRIPAGALLIPMIIGSALESSGLVAITLPQWLLALGYAVLGWGIGLSFTRQSLVHASRALPVILLSIVVLIGASGLLAALLVYLAGIDPMTAYLATSPGGMDSVVIIGAATHADLSFVMALQTVRFLIVLIVGPPLARFIAQRLL